MKRQREEGRVLVLGFRLLPTHLPFQIVHEKSSSFLLPRHRLAIAIALFGTVILLALRRTPTFPLRRRRIKTHLDLLRNQRPKLWRVEHDGDDGEVMTEHSHGSEAEDKQSR
ncbi:uncharacterized protein G2W53_004784 [Senna tora]|uniref:Transmembrane protein n=1 Tax=Senna tora TaxID=362788 RepID=A0A835CGR9_9FABA|nr:uncharacterized protein G2W53_004784 [Senna tora]